MPAAVIATRPSGDRRAISVPLAPVATGLSRTLTGSLPHSSGHMKARITQIPKLIVRVRFPSTAPQREGRGDDGRVSFDLHVFPPSGPRTVAEVWRLLDAEEQRLLSGSDDALPPPGPEMDRFLDELERRWPSLEEDPGGSPWSSWPLWLPMTGGGTALAIRWSRATEMRTALLEIAARTNVIIYDGQLPEVICPPG